MRMITLMGTAAAALTAVTLLATPATSDAPLTAMQQPG